MNANREPVWWSEVPFCKFKTGLSVYSRFTLTELRSEQGIRNIAGLEKYRVKPPLNKDASKLHRTCCITRPLFGCQLWPGVIIWIMSISWNSQTKAKCFDLPVWSKTVVVSPSGYNKIRIWISQHMCTDRSSKLEKWRTAGWKLFRKGHGLPVGDNMLYLFFLA